MATHDEDDDARSVFFRMIDMGNDVEESMKVLAFWMWLDTQGFQKIITTISSHDDKILGLVYNEAVCVFSSFQMSESPISSYLMRVTKTLTQGSSSSLDVILGDKEKVLKSITDVHVGKCCTIFEDMLKERGVEVAKEVESVKKFWRGFYAKGTGESKLNPFAKEWGPKANRVSEEDRCLFLTFSNGYPLTEMQIINFFNESYGPYVERVYVHWPDPMNRRKVPPLFGKVVFKTYYMPIMILGGRNEVKFWVDRKPLWCKRFNPQRKIGKNY